MSCSRRRPDLGKSATDEAAAFRAPAAVGRARSRLSRRLRRPALSCACCRCSPSHLSFPQIGAGLFLSPHTVKSEDLDLPEAGGCSRARRVVRFASWGSAVTTGLSSHRGDKARQGIGVMMPDGEWRCMGQMARFQDTLRRLAMIDEGFVEDDAGVALGQAAASALGIPIGVPWRCSGRCVRSHRVIGCLPGVERGPGAGGGRVGGRDCRRVAGRIPVAGLGRVVSAAPDLATALGYDIWAALEKPDDH